MANLRNNKYVIRTPKFQESMPSHDGTLIGPGFPVLMGTNILSEAKGWACPVMSYGTKEQIELIKTGNSVSASLHTHDYDEIYLFAGQDGALTYEIYLGDDTYTVGTPSAVFIPEGLPHGFKVLDFVEGKYGGMTAICLSTDYITNPVPENPLKLNDTKHLIVEGYKWKSAIPCHNSGIDGKGFPIIMSKDLVPEAKTWICPALVEQTPEISAAINSGMSPSSTPHTHTEDEIYLVIGEPGSGVIQVQLDDEFYTVAPPASVYVPAGTVHSIKAVYATPSKWGGSCTIFLGEDYIAYPAK